jgi:hypothetical protein
MNVKYTRFYILYISTVFSILYDLVICRLYSTSLFESNFLNVHMKLALLAAVKKINKLM